MVKIHSFKGIRPKEEFAAKIAAPPYDVINSKEARELAKGNDVSFLHITRPEIDFDPSIDEHDDVVYDKGAENLRKFINQGLFFEDKEPCFYIYKQIMGDHSQVGLVVCASAEEYWNNTIKKHELTRKDKEDDRTRHVLAHNANAEPVFLTYHAKEEIDKLIEKAMQDKPVYDFTTNYSVEVRHIFWVVNDKEWIEKVTKEFEKIDYMYIADGHHRSASAGRAYLEKKSKNPNHTGNEEYNYFLAILFPHNQMYIMDYNRIVKDLNGLTEEEFINKVKEKFSISEAPGKEPYRPTAMHEFGMFLNDKWYILKALDGTFDKNDPIESLDVAILQNNLLAPILGIGDPRTDKRIDFVGGIRGLKELEKRVKEDNFKVAFSMYPTTIEQLMAVADANKIMPPKSTWFEPKLISGLIIHSLD